jgi:hypothetical protein
LTFIFSDPLYRFLEMLGFVLLMATLAFFVILLLRPTRANINTGEDLPIPGNQSEDEGQ